MFHHISKHHEVPRNILLRAVFDLSSRCLEMLESMVSRVYVVLMKLLGRHTLPAQSLSVERFSSSAKQKRAFCYNPVIKEVYYKMNTNNTSVSKSSPSSSNSLSISSELSMGGRQNQQHNLHPI